MPLNLMDSDWLSVFYRSHNHSQSEMPTDLFLHVVIATNCGVHVANGMS